MSIYDDPNRRRTGLLEQDRSPSRGFPDVQYGPEQPQDVQYGPERPSRYSGPRPQAQPRYGTDRHSGPRPQGQPRYPQADRNELQRGQGQPRYPAPDGPSQFEPHTQQVDQNQLMSTQLDSLLDANSPLMQRAAQQGIDHAASRGLGNSSIAAGNAQGAMMDRAMPIAQFDAGRYGNVADQNMNALNQGGMFNAQMGENARQFDASFGQRDRQFDATLGFNYDQLSQQDRHFGMDFAQRDQHFLQNYGLNRDQFAHTVDRDWAQMAQQDQHFQQNYGLNRDQFSHMVDRDWAQLSMQDQHFLQRLGFDEAMFEDAKLQWRAAQEQQDRHFQDTLQFNRDQLFQQNEHFFAAFGLDQQRFDETVRQFDQQFGEQIRQFNDTLGFQNQQLAAQVHSTMMSTLAPILSSVYGNPELTAEQQTQIASNIVNSIFPGMSNTAWSNIPPGIINPSVLAHAFLMPPINPPGGGTQPPGDGPQPPGDGTQPPPGGGGYTPPSTIPHNWTPEAWQVWQNIQEMQNGNWQAP